MEGVDTNDAAVTDSRKEVAFLSDAPPVFNKERKSESTPRKRTCMEKVAPQPTGLFSQINNLRPENQRLQLRRPSVLPVELSAERFFAEKSQWAYLAKNPVFEGTTLFVVALNAVWIGIDTDHNGSPDLLHAKMKFIVMENFFCFYFTFEVLTRFLAFAKKRNCMKDFWFKFDSFLVTLMVLETWVIPLIMGGAGGVGQLSILRLLRLLRLSRMARLMRALPSLVILMKGMRAATRSVLTTLVLLVIILYIFGIIFTMQIGRDPDHHENFGTLPMSMYNLFLGATLLDDCTNVFKAFKDSESTTANLMLYAMLLFILISSFTVLNMLIGVLCEVASATKDSETDLADWSVASQRLTAAFAEIDEDKTGTVSKKEFLKMTEKEEVLTAFEILNVEPKDLLALSDALFEPDNDAQEEKELSFADFLDVVWNNRPGISASVLDIRQFSTALRMSSMRESLIIDRLYHCIKDEIPAIDESVIELELENKLEAMQKKATQLQKTLQQIKKAKSLEFEVAHA
eukprot:GEMP01036461.1.p1 GENE.GEMP01036461.1~~GEMP01036461.1.p1  ORF type:complete len:516 (+),score=94.15 GEMP01036461.1:39-1586(+)